MTAYPNATYRAMVCGGGSVLAEQTGLADPAAAVRWIKGAAKRIRGVDYGSYRINLDDARWTRVSF